MGFSPTAIIIALIILFLTAKFLAVAIGVVYKELRDLRKDIRNDLNKILDTLSSHG